MFRRIELEGDLEGRCVDRVKAIGGKALKLVLIGSRGIPDRTILLPGGRVFFVEFKRPKLGTVAAQQHQWRRWLEDLGFKVYTVDSDADFDKALYDNR